MWFESSQKDQSRSLSGDSSKAYPEEVELLIIMYLNKLLIKTKSCRMLLQEKH